MVSPPIISSALEHVQGILQAATVVLQLLMGSVIRVWPRYACILPQILVVDAGE